MNTDELKEALKEEIQERVQKATEEIAAVCEKHKVALNPQIELSHNNVSAKVSVIPTE